ncbi:MAG: hypothetical protein P8I46_11370, partial [Pseudomonadales bacterium]|nr:hypothetical protein [Pseudomonadales bacterium]
MASHSTTDNDSSTATNPDQQGSSRIPNFFRMPIEQRISALHQRGLISNEDVRLLSSGNHQVQLNVADKMIENVVGVFGLPMGVALNFLINNRDYVVPLVVEEPSIVAGLSGAARMARLGGGFSVDPVDPVLIGQVQIVIDSNPEQVKATLLEHREDIVALANSLHPKMVARGGGALDIEVSDYQAEEDGRLMVVMHLLVDTRDAMGAN